MLALFGFDLLRPGALAALLLCALLAGFGLWSLFVRRRLLERFVAPRRLPRFLPDFSVARARVRLALAVAAAVFLAVALTGPVRGYTVREVRRKGLDLVVCLDTSRSMLVRDLRPDRLSRAKREVIGLLQRLRGDRVALIAFSGDVREIAPLTHDRKTLSALLETVSPEENVRGGTDLGGALERALRLFDGRTGAHEAVVLITDGEDLEGRALEVARQAEERGIRVYLVGMGTAEGGKIPIGLPNGEQGFVTGPEGQEVVSRLDGTTLEAIAEQTGGAYLDALRSPTPLEDLYDGRIARLEGRELGAGEERVPHDRFQWPLVLAVACMLVEAGLREIRPRRAGFRAGLKRRKAA